MAPSQSLIVGYQKLVVQVSALTKQEALEWADAIRETARDQSNKTFFPSNLFLRTWTCWNPSRKCDMDILKVVLGQVFNFKLDSFASKQNTSVIFLQPVLELKTWPRFCPVSLSLSMVPVDQQ